MKTKLILILFITCFNLTNANAVNGVIEINQTCASQLGCFSGDTTGYPVTINGSAGSSYRLTSDLIIPNTNTNAIAISVPNINIDLNGFSIIGTACVGATTNCRPASFSVLGNGIDVSLTSISNISIMNGKIIGMGGHGASLTGTQSSAKNMVFKWNAGHGLGIGSKGKIINNSFIENSINGATFSDGTIVSNNISSDNGGGGLKGFSYATIVNNITNNNGSDGIFAQGLASFISGNTSSNNGDDGIACSSYCIIKNNITSTNTGFGLNIFTNSTYKDNILYNNGSTINGGVNMGGNLCGSTTCI